MQFIDLKTQYRRIQESVQQRMNRVFEHSQFILGPEVEELEQRLAEYVGVKHCMTVSNGTDALLIALMALDIGPGDEVITTPFSFIATATMTKLLGAKPVFVDIDPKTYNIDPRQIEQAITPRTKVILPVNLYGQCAEYDPINALAEKYGLHVVEDAAQSFGATYKGRQSGNLGNIGCTSFFPSKPLGCYGEGGACFTDSDELATSIKQIRNHGQDRRYHHIRLGLNGRLDTLQAAVLLAKLEIFPAELKQRDQIATMYNYFLDGYVATPYIESHNESTFAQYTIQIDQRDWVAQKLKEQQIPTAVHYPIPIDQQPLFNKKHLNGDSHFNLPYSESVAGRVLSLPFHPYLEESEVAKIAAHIIENVQVDGTIEAAIV